MVWLLLKKAMISVAHLFLLCAFFFSSVVMSETPNSSSPSEAKVYFVSPKQGSVFDRSEGSEIEVVFGIKGMQVAPAGMATPNSGHHHLLINMSELPDLTLPLPASDQVLHFGKGQTMTVIDLAPGTHRLQLVLGNHVHIPHSPPVLSEIIEIEIK
jgi:hypothetical protein